MRCPVFDSSGRVNDSRVAHSFAALLLNLRSAIGTNWLKSHAGNLIRQVTHALLQFQRIEGSAGSLPTRPCFVVRKIVNVVVSKTLCDSGKFEFNSSLYHALVEERVCTSCAGCGNGACFWVGSGHQRRSPCRCSQAVQIHWVPECWHSGVHD